MGSTPEERFEVRLDGGHGVGDQFGQAGGVGRGLVHDVVVASRLREPEGAAADVVGGLDLPPGHAAGGLVVLDLSGGGVEAVGGVAEEDDAQDGHEVVAGGELGIGAEIVGGFPEVGFELLEVHRVGWVTKGYAGPLARA